MMQLIHYPACSTCRKAKAWLEGRGVSYTDRHIKECSPTAEELRQWQKISGLPLKKFFNTSGMKYRELNLKERLPGMPEEEQLQLLASDGMLVKRPLLICGDRVFVGFKPEQWEKLL